VARALKHWGWGYEDEQPSGPELRGAAEFFAGRFGFGAREPELPVPLSEVTLPPSRLRAPEALAPISSTDPYVRALHCYGRSYVDLVRAFRGRFDHPPDVIVHPRSEADVGAALDWAASAGAAVIPFGGGTSVVGGVEAAGCEGYAGVVTIDLKALDRVLEVDPVSLSARIQAGATGPRLEEQLGQHGLTLRHFPQSFQFSTLGGWIATRAGGHFATLYTHIDDLVESVRALTPAGVWESRRLIDAREAEVTGAGDGSHALLVLGFESADHDVERWLTTALECCADHGGDWGPPTSRGASDREAVDSWREAFLRAPYLRDVFIAIGVLSETFETAITWEHFPAFHDAVGRTHRPWYDRQRPEPFAAALRGAKAAVDPRGVLNPGVLIDP
jgi:FAD binding domain/FAD linked oxidases, C-terminal domain